MEHQSTNEVLESEFLELFRPSSYIPAAECRADTVYWIGCRRISPIAICRGVDKTGVAFQGLREKMGDFFLFSEYHYDDDELFGTVTPYVELGPAPQIIDTDELMYWFLDQEIDLVKTRLDWLKYMPARFRGSDIYEFVVEAESASLVSLTTLKTEGFEAQERLTFKSIFQKRDTARSGQLEV